MARRPVHDVDDDEDETPPWMEKRAPRSPRGAASRDDAGPTHTLITWRALIVGAALALIAAIGLVIGVRRMSTPDATVATANGEVPLIRAPAEPYKTRVGADAGVAAAAPGTDAAQAADPIGALAAGQDAPPEPHTQPRAPTELMPGASPANDPIDATAEAPGAADLAPPPVQASAPSRPKAEARPISPPDRPKNTDATAAAPRTRPENKPVAKAADPATSTFKLPAQDLAATKPRMSGDALQLGAFSSQEKAEAAWASATAAHGELAALHRRIEPIERDGRTLYRLRVTVTGPLTPARCAAYRAMGAVCVGR